MTGFFRLIVFQRTPHSENRLLSATGNSFHSRLLCNLLSKSILDILLFNFNYYICSNKTTLVDIKQLNKTELQIMKYLWKLEKGFMKDIVEQFPEPRPAYTTIATQLSRMAAKNYISWTKLGRDKQYFPVLQKNDYFSNQVKNMITHFFNDSALAIRLFFYKKY